MKILLTTDTWVPAINGVVTSTATLRAALTAQGHEVRVLTLSGDCHTYIKDGVTSLGSLDAGLVYPGARLRAPALNRAIRDLIDWRPDIVHSQCEFSTFAPARRIAHAAGAPLIHTYHTVYEDYTHYFSPSRSMGAQDGGAVHPHDLRRLRRSHRAHAQNQPPVGGLRRALPGAHHPHGAGPAALCCAPG